MDYVVAYLKFNSKNDVFLNILYSYAKYFKSWVKKINMLKGAALSNIRVMDYVVSSLKFDQRGEVF